ncbi:MAG TPA: CoA pyrophosphatase [Chloroflexota bacterium]|nr:CoA pyrophosphatase [Chloroflexota bacterium]
MTDSWIRQLAERLGPADSDPELPVDLRRAAVLMLLYQEKGDFRMPLIERPRGQGVHGGQFALPGGAYDPADDTLKTTALREAWEEVAVDPGAVEMLGRLPPVQVRVSGFVVVPFVGWSPAMPRLYPHDAEVERIIHMPIAMLRDADSVAEVPAPAGSSHATMFEYHLPEGKVWGATARMLVSLGVVLRELPALNELGGQFRVQLGEG